MCHYSICLKIGARELVSLGKIMVSKFFQLVSSQNFYSMVTSIARIQIIKDLLHVFLWCLYSLDTILQTLSSCSTLAYLAQTWEWDIKTSATMISVTTTMRRVMWSSLSQFLTTPMSHRPYTCTNTYFEWD